MTTITPETPTYASTGRLEELVDRLLATLFRDEPERPAPALARAIHDARRLRQTGDFDGALVALAAVDPKGAADFELRWLYTEWLDISRRRFAGGDAVLYSPATGNAAVLVPGNGDENTLEAVAILGMSWPVGKKVSRRSLRGLKTLAKGGA